MNWITVYITGRVDFKEDVGKKIDRADINIMPGYIDNSQSRIKYDLYWLDEKIDLRTFKEAIGGKLIWRYRLRFYTTQEAFEKSQRNSKDFELTEEDRLLIENMRRVA